MKSGTYVIAQGDQTEEDERLRLLVSLLDPATHEYLMEAGIGPGWRCLEVGAGSGTVASWMADQVGDDGRIVAVDIDTSRLASLAGRGVEVRQHDVTNRPVEHGSFDLVHARAVLMHVADPMQALKNMVAGIAPGGWLVVSDADFATWRCVTRAHPHAAMFDEVSRSMWDALDERGVMSSYLASGHIDLFDQLDVEDVQSFGRYDVVRGGSPGARFWQLTLTSMMPLFLGADILDEETASVMLGLCDDPTFAFFQASSTVTRGRRRS